MINSGRRRSMTSERNLDESLVSLVPLNFDGLSYEEYFKKVEVLIEKVRHHWRSEQRVKSLKGVIQLTKLLADTSQIKLYAKKYKMITDLLDEYGKLVHKRIHSLADPTQQSHENPSSSSSSSFGIIVNEYDSTMARERARDTCKNWFLKVASIRELVPRFYLEISILRSCDILLRSTSTDGCHLISGVHNVATINKEQLYSQSLMRLSKAAWGFGDPIVALYARAYLCKLANQMITWNMDSYDNGITSTSTSTSNSNYNINRSILFEIIQTNLKASILVVSQLNSSTVIRALRVQNVSMWSFFDLISSALQSISNTITHKDDLYTNEDELSDNAIELFGTMLTDSLKLISGHGNKKASAREGSFDCSILASNIVLHSIIRSMPASIIVKQHQIIMDVIKSSYESWIEFKEVMMDEIMPTFYATLESLALALDASGEFEKQVEIYPIGKKQEIFHLSRRIIDQLISDDIRDHTNNNSTINNLSSSTTALRPQYLRSFKAWLSYANHYLHPAEVDKFLLEFIERIRQIDGQYLGQHQTYIVELIKALISSGKKSLDDFRQLFAMKSFQSLLDLLNGRDDLRLETSRLIFETMRIELKLGRKVNQYAATATTVIVDGGEHDDDDDDDESTSASAGSGIESAGCGGNLITDKKMINFIVTKLFATINDSLNPLADDDDIVQLSQLIVLFMELISIPDYIERLDFLSKCRSSLNNINPMLDYLARKTIQLAKDYRKSSERRRNQRRNYLNGCLAFTFITIPAIDNPLNRLELLQLGANLALRHMSLSLADYYLRQIMINLTDLVQVVQQQQQQHQHQPPPSTGLATGNGQVQTIDTYRRDHQSIKGSPIQIFNSSGNNDIMYRQLVKHVQSILDLMLKYQDYIDLRFKLALSDLIEKSSSLNNDDSQLTEQSKFLKLVVNDECSNNAQDGE